MDTSASEDVGEPRPFACVRCWKLKKKCSRERSKCDRCRLLNVSCVYSLLPPTERPETLLSRALPLISPKKQPLNVEKHCLAGSNPKSCAITTGLGAKLTEQSLAAAPVAQIVWNEVLSVQLHSAFNVRKPELMSTCNRYLGTMNVSLPILLDAQFRKHLEDLDRTPEMDVLFLLLSVHLVTEIAVPVPGGGTDLEALYSILKPSFIQLATVRRPSIELIQAGMLLAIYEQGQAKDEATYLTLGTCARLGHAMGLHKSLMADLPLELRLKETINTQRHVWWGLIILDRLLALEASTPDRPFVTNHPSLEDHLPSSSDRDVDSTLPIGQFVGTNSSREIIFNSANSYARCCQATYLLGQVFELIGDDTRDWKSCHVDVPYLDRTLQALSFSIIEQSNGEKGVPWEYSCASWMICMLGLCALHRYNLLRNLPFDHNDLESKERARASQLALLSCSRIAINGADTKLYDRVEGALNAPPFALYLFREMSTLVLQMGFEEGKNIKGLVDEIDSLRKYLSIASEKWKLAKNHLDAIDQFAAKLEKASSFK